MPNNERLTALDVLVEHLRRTVDETADELQRLRDYVESELAALRRDIQRRD